MEGKGGGVGAETRLDVYKRQIISPVRPYLRTKNAIKAKSANVSIKAPIARKTYKKSICLFLLMSINQTLILKGKN